MTDPQEIVAYAETKYGPLAEGTEFLEKYVALMPPYRKSEHPVGGWVKKGRTYEATKVTPAETLLRKLEADSSLTAEEKAPIVATIKAAMDKAAEQAKATRIADYAAQAQAL